MFPQLPSGQNPYASEAASYASSAASLANALHSAANQIAIRKRQQAEDYAKAQKDEFEARRQVRTEGGVPTETYAAGYDPVPGRPTLATPEANPEAQGAGQHVTTPGGKEYYVPTDQEQGKTFIPAGQLGETLKKYGWDGKTPIKPTDSHSIMMAINEAAPKDEPFAVDTSGKFHDAQGNPVPVIVGKKTGKVRILDLSGVGGEDTAAQMAATPAQGEQQGLPPGYLGGMGGLPGGAFSGGVTSNATPAQPVIAPGGGRGNGPFTFAPPEKPERKETPDDWVRMITDPATPAAEKKRAQDALTLWRAPGTESDKDRDLQRAAMNADRADRKSERADTRAEAQAKTNRGIEATKKKAIAKAISDYRKVTTGTVVTPELKKTALDQLRSDLDEAQRGYESDVSTETGGDVPHNPWAQTFDPDAPANAPNDPAGLRPKGAGKKADPLGIR